MEKLLIGGTGTAYETLAIHLIEPNLEQKQSRRIRNFYILGKYMVVII
jgi:hypothetical protein